LGPVLHKDHPGLKIIGYDHNKDHVVTWAKALYNDSETKSYFDGIGVHWYGGLNQRNLNATHYIAPDKFILATEACNCGGVVFKNQSYEWWTRAEKLAIDILEDILWWSSGWTDWNLLLDTKGGPNHLGNLCDANIIVDANKSVASDVLIMQASYYFMGQFSRYIPAGSRRVALNNSVKVDNDVTPGQVLGKKTQFLDCHGDHMSWSYQPDTNKTLTYLGLCLQANESSEFVFLANCKEGDKSQQWDVEALSNSHHKITSVLNGKCLSSKQTQGNEIGLDPGVDVDAGMLLPCSNGTVPGGVLAPIQNFTFTQGKYPQDFHLQTTKETCMLPAGIDSIKFDAVAFETPTGQISMVAMNLGNTSLTFDVYDTSIGAGVKEVQLPPHSIATYTWTPTNMIVFV
jgi:glucosylceramidase